MGYKKRFVNSQKILCKYETSATSAQKIARNCTIEIQLELDSKHLFGSCKLFGRYSQILFICLQIN